MKTSFCKTCSIKMNWWKLWRKATLNKDQWEKEPIKNPKLEPISEWWKESQQNLKTGLTKQDQVNPV